jgi:hypothetical protein
MSPPKIFSHAASAKDTAEKNSLSLANPPFCPGWLSRPWVVSALTLGFICYCSCEGGTIVFPIYYNIEVTAIKKDK